MRILQLWIIFTCSGWTGLVRVNKVFCPLKFRYARRNLSIKGMRILYIGCGNNSPTLAKRWLPGSHYSGADIQRYNNSDADLAAMDNFYLLGVDGVSESQ